MQESELKSLIRNANPDNLDNFATRCHNTLCYTALFARLPDEFQIDIWRSWKLNPYLLGVKLFMGDGLTLFMEEEFSDLLYIRKSFKWYTKHTEARTLVCWLRDLEDDIDYHWTPLGAVNSLFVTEASRNYNMPRRMEELPAVRLRKEEPLCFNRTQPRYARLKKQAEWMLRDVNGRKEYWDYETLIKDYDTWAGIMGPAMKNMMRKTYVCPPHMTCHGEKASSGVPFKPKSYTNFLDELRRVMRENAPFCFAMNNQFPDESGYYWFIPGTKTDNPTS
ncbi:hypothetical protein CDD81_540 [Ophiocordyceps australis]|uniref:Uncharacterized protein n=1 Tax=Ophiocordyceps australis TaxID=1399860 RepID=A0A2C5Y953_9HYPO|nr:hypothetical protein CDD81_540 [Ophiocordyceps australis]